MQDGTKQHRNPTEYPRIKVTPIIQLSQLPSQRRPCQGRDADNHKYEPHPRRVINVFYEPPGGRCEERLDASRGETAGAADCDEGCLRVDFEPGEDEDSGEEG